MSTTPAPKKTYELVAIFFLLPALFIQIKWLQVFSGNGMQSADVRKAAFLKTFPGNLSSTTAITLISLACAILAIFFASKSFNQPKMVWRISSFIVVFAGSLIALLSIFQLI